MSSRDLCGTCFANPSSGILFRNNSGMLCFHSRSWTVRGARMLACPSVHVPATLSRQHKCKPTTPSRYMAAKTADVCLHCTHREHGNQPLLQRRCVPPVSQARLVIFLISHCLIFRCVSDIFWAACLSQTLPEMCSVTTAEDAQVQRSWTMRLHVLSPIGRRTARLVLFPKVDGRKFSPLLILEQLNQSPLIIEVFFGMASF